MLVGGAGPIGSRSGVVASVRGARLRAKVIIGDALTALAKIADGTVQTCITSPPYYGLRNYGCTGQVGLEATLDEYVKNQADIFDEVWRILQPNGTLWLNVGDIFAGGGRGPTGETGIGNQAKRQGFTKNPVRLVPEGFKPKDLILVGPMLVIELQRRGWIFRSEIIWEKSNGMPGSQKDRPTVSHEKIYLLSKGPQYRYDCEAVKEPLAGSGAKAGTVLYGASGGKPLRSVWKIPVSHGGKGHFATFPVELVRRCIHLTSNPGDTVLDPFGGTGTTGKVALELGRNAILVELNPRYIAPFIVRYGVKRAPQHAKGRVSP